MFLFTTDTVYSWSASSDASFTDLNQCALVSLPNSDLDSFMDWGTLTSRA
jgi:hypothetical protein